MWLLDDREAERQHIGLELELPITRVARLFDHVDKNVLARAVLLLHASPPAVLWFSLFAAGTPRGTKRDHMAARCLPRLARVAKTLGCVVLVDGQTRNLA